MTEYRRPPIPLSPGAPLTPSRAHDQAFKRDRGHDAIQREVVAFLRRRSLCAIPKGAILHRTVEAEMPIYRRGQIIAFADAAEILTVNLTVTASMFEVKPKIHTTFGIIRQAKTLLSLAKETIPADFHLCHIVVPASDPLFPDLRAQIEDDPAAEEIRTWAWGAAFKDIEVAHD